MPINTALVDQLNTTSRWYHLDGSKVDEISFGFTTSSAFASGRGEESGWKAFNAKQEASSRKALELWDDLIAPSFVESADPNVGDIKFSQTTSNIGFAHAYFPGIVGREVSSSDRMNGSVWLNAGNSTLRDPDVGEYGFQTIIHEIGHALGLNHAGNYNGGSPRYGDTKTGWLYTEDTWQFTVMSYFNSSNTGADWYSNGNVRVQTPMVYDILAIQEKYGADFTTRAGDTTYGFNSNAGNDIYDFTVNARPVMTIWDGAGNDTIDLSGFSADQRLDLAEGAYSDVGVGLTLNFAIAYGAKIENGVGGSGNDSLSGNALGNILKGGAGNDVLYGLGGDDTLEGGSGNDVFHGGLGNDIVRGGSGLDIVKISAASTEVTVQEVTGGVTILGEGLDHVFNDVEQFAFSDKTLSYAEVLTLIAGAPNPDPDPDPDPVPDPDPAPKPDGAIIDFEAADISSYSNQDRSPDAFAVDGDQLTFTGNSWKKLAIDYNIDADTMLTFSFRSSQLGEIHGIGFDTDNRHSSTQYFNLFGEAGWGIRDFEYTGNGEWQTFTIRLGDYVDGDISYLTFINDDDDAGNGLGRSEFANVSIYQDGQVPDPDPTPDPDPDPNPVAPPLDFSALQVTSYSNQDRAPDAFTVSGNTISLDGNSWKKVETDYSVTADTILTFSFRALKEGEIQGVGFDTDNQHASTQYFNLFGESGYGISDFKYTGNGEWQTFTIRLGDYVQGDISYLTFINDDDNAGNGLGASEIRDVRIFEEGANGSEEGDVFDHRGHDHGPCGHDGCGDHCNHDHDDNEGGNHGDHDHDGVPGIDADIQPLNAVFADKGNFVAQLGDDDIALLMGGFSDFTLLDNMPAIL
ncbi:M10 family metallopeptidase C-terminal domain-containing protein [Pacificimonas sp. WHA3]|uniref:M10 family metallopeptidase C-terminal domain-containing protein n=1 Tax=Pacificimonas pallii TaxID=2827236 RepID=A0ABS6SBD4_9SPHN|nr:M10 family metallopeptidase [Pacificimonas pallii]MBV7255727.1 M10 family metallopeptidase C-terminal domain-containing protein [Pacificimonas pallii]